MNSTPIQKPAIQYAPGPVGGPMAWRAADLAQDQRWIHRLTEEEVAELEAAAERSRSDGLEILQIRKENFPLPLLANKIAALRADLLTNYGFGYMRGLPVQRYDRETLTRIYFGLSRHIGDPVPQNRNGHMLGHVIDIGTDVNDYSKRITQTAVDLGFHSDGCDVVGLVCIHTAKSGGASAIVSAISVHDEMLRLRPDLCHALYEPVLFDRRGEIPEGKMPWIRMPVFSWANGVFNAYAPLPNYVESAKRFTDAPQMTALQVEAFDYYLKLCGDPTFAVHIPFEQGDFQFVHNHVVLHARTAFEDWPEASKKRHLMRMWLSMPDGRELPLSLAERWINIERGTVRGGVNIPDRKALTIPLEAEAPAYQ